MTIAGALATLVAVSPSAAADPVRDAQWFLDFLRVTQAQQYSQGEGVIVGVVDTGVDAKHPDLAGSVLPGYSLGPFGDPYQDVAGHGTAMAGLIAAHGRSLGIAPKAKILPIKNSQMLIGSTLPGGIRIAVDHGATVLCLAFGSYGNEIDREDVQYAIDHDVVVVAAVGNTDEPGGPFPAAYAGVVGAAGIDRSGNHAPTSVITSAAVLAAPAVDIEAPDSSSRPGSTGYSPGTGTSNSTAIIAGAAALVRAKFPGLSAVEVIHRLTATADDKGPPGRDDQYGYGIVNLVKALTADVPPLTPSAVPASPAATKAAPTTPAGKGVPPLVIGLLILAALAAAAVIVGGVRTRTRSN
jgi:subtilisin family serine protease